MVPVVPIVAGLVSIDQGKRLDHPAAVPIVAGGLVTSIDQGNRASAGPRGPRGDDHRPGEASGVAGPRGADDRPGAVPALSIVPGSGEHRPGQPSRGRVRGADRRRSPGDEHRPGEASAVPACRSVPGVRGVDRRRPGDEHRPGQASAVAGAVDRPSWCPWCRSLPAW